MASSGPHAWSWGWGEFGRLGHGDKESRYTPAPLFQDCLVEVVAIACGAHHTVAVSRDGGIAVWGWGSEGQLGVGSCEDQLRPTVLHRLAVEGHRVSRVACGYYHSLAVLRDGSVLSWGKGDCGQLGLGSLMGSLVPRVIEGLAAERVTHVACGSVHSLAVTHDGAVFAWGHGSDGQLGLGRGDGEEQADVSVPVQVPALRGVVVAGVACGSRHSLCVTRDARVFAWGLGDDGRLGIKLDDGQTHLYEPTAVPLRDVRVRSAAAGGHHSMLCTEGGEVMTCGRGEQGQLGHGDFNNQHAFQMVRALRDLSVAKVSCGDAHSGALTMDGEVYTWGAAEEGQVGNGYEERVSIPALVKGMMGPVGDLSCGLLHTVAVQAPASSGHKTVRELQRQVQDLEALLQTAETAMQEERRQRLVAERRLHESDQRIARMDRVNALKQRGVESVTDSSPRPFTTSSSVSLVSVGVQTDGAPAISPAQMLMDLRRPRLGPGGSAQSNRQVTEDAHGIEAEARKRGNIVRRAAEIHSCPQNTRVGREEATFEVDSCPEGGGREEGDSVGGRIEQQAAFLDGFGDPSEIDLIHSSAMFHSESEDVDLLLEKDLSEEDDTAETGSVCSSRSLPRWEEVAQERQQLGTASGQADLVLLNGLGTSGSKAALLGSSASGSKVGESDHKREAARLSALQFVSEQQHATVRVAKEREIPAQANGSSAAQISLQVNSTKPPTTASKKLLHSTGSKMKRGVMGFFRELKDELVAERPGD